MPRTYTEPITKSDASKAEDIELLSDKIYSILLVPNCSLSSSSLFCERSNIFKCASLAIAFLIASVPATPAPITVTTRRFMFSTEPRIVPIPPLGLSRKYWPTTTLIWPAILLIGARSGNDPSEDVTVS